MSNFDKYYKIAIIIMWTIFAFITISSDGVTNEQLALLVILSSLYVKYG